MSIFNRLFYKLLRLYNQGFIWYDVYLRRAAVNMYYKIYMNSIVQVTRYDSLGLDKDTLFRKTPHDILKDYLCFHRYSDTSYRVSSFSVDQKKDSLFPLGIPPIFEVECWDGRRYFTRKDFDVHSRPLCQKRHKCIHASIVDKIDVTDFINKHPESFVEENHIDLVDVLCMMFMDGKIRYDLFHELISDDEKFMYVIDDDTLDIRTFKDNEFIIL